MFKKRLVVKVYVLWIVAFLAIGFAYSIADNLNDFFHVDNWYWLVCQWVPRGNGGHESGNAWARFQVWADLGLCFVGWLLWEGLNIGRCLFWLFRKTGGEEAYLKLRSRLARKDNDGVTPEFHPPGGGAHP